MLSYPKQSDSTPTNKIYVPMWLKKTTHKPLPQSCHPDVGENPLVTPQTNFTHNLVMLNSIQHLTQTTTK